MSLKRSYNLLLLLAALLACFAAACKERVPRDADTVVFVETPSPAPETAAPEITSAPTPAPTPEPTPEPFRYIDVSSSDYDLGGFVLVNYAHEYVHVDQMERSVVPLHGNTSAKLLLSNNEHALDRSAMEALDRFAAGFYAQTGGDRLFVTSSFRTLAYQQRVYDDYVKKHGEEMAKLYVADPGFSEHHTGLAVDLSTMSKKGERVALINHGAFYWVKQHCADYGFILRYPVGSEDITHVAYEPWHFRYLGIPMAKAVYALNMTYEEFAEQIRQYSVESGMLLLTEGEGGEANIDVVYPDSIPERCCLVYFVPKSDAETTLIPVPNCIPQSAKVDISGDNERGFIVVITLGGAFAEND